MKPTNTSSPAAAASPNRQPPSSQDRHPPGSEKFTEAADNNTFEPVDENIQTVVRLASESYKRRTPAARIGMAITGFFGTIASILIHVAIILGWCLYNSGKIKDITPFDPYPFNLLTLCVSFEGVLIALFVLLTQNRMSRQSELRTHLNLQLEMLIEQEVTTCLALVKKIAEKQGIEENEPVVDKLSKATDVEKLAEELEEKMPLDT